ncbi:hypothetical protein TrVE_jg4696 [Triparma verrucosa]|uniref:C2H2-type domain-containing protein n=2 Tax=Triparma verrucosa TaxID=1606542 RepID=A0A9W7BZT3_9STRA|nr:hypothetical protein TrVE_jg4696 [Triparma verrucosa]
MATFTPLPTSIPLTPPNPLSKVTETAVATALLNFAAVPVVPPPEAQNQLTEVPAKVKIQRKSRAKDPTNPRIPSIKIPLRIKGVVRNKWGGIIRTCGIDGCEYKIGNPNHMKSHKAAKHNVNVRWFSCDQAGCDYKAKQASNLKGHKATKHGINVIMHKCTVPGCNYEAKEAGKVKRHKADKHGINATFFHCTEPNCNFQAKRALVVKQHRANIHDIDVVWHYCKLDGCTFRAKESRSLGRHQRTLHKRHFVIPGTTAPITSPI